MNYYCQKKTIEGVFFNELKEIPLKTFGGIMRKEENDDLSLVLHQKLQSK